MIGFWADFFTFLQVAIGLFLIFIIMLQRGKGGGLVGALGGMGGASAFGPKADIQVLKLTIGLAVAWVVIACVGIFFNRSYERAVYNPTGEKTEQKGTDSKDKKDKDGDTKDADAKDAKAKDDKGAVKKTGDETKAEKGTATPESTEGEPAEKAPAKGAADTKPKAKVTPPADDAAKTEPAEKK